MPCYHPINAWQTTNGEVIFAERGDVRRTLTLPCGQCRGCRLKRSRQWAIRCLHEAKTYTHNCVTLLTYDDQHIPDNGDLTHRHVALFLKRLRQHAHREQTALLIKGALATAPTILTTTPHADMGLRPIPRPDIRYYMCGEYGEQNNRPHYHMCLFNCDFADKKYKYTTPAGSQIHTSETLNNIWQLGHTSIGELNFESAAYTARYIMKKITGDLAKQHYESLNTETGEIFNRTPEYNQMSRRPGIGAKAFDKWGKDWYPQGKVITRGHQSNTPRYYDNLQKTLDSSVIEELQYKRYLEGLKQAADNTPERLKVREDVEAAKIKFLQRH